MIESLESSPLALGGDLASGVHALLRDAFPDDAPSEGDYYRTHGAPRAVIILREAPHVIAHLGATAFFICRGLTQITAIWQSFAVTWVIRVRPRALSIR